MLKAREEQLANAVGRGEPFFINMHSLRKKQNPLSKRRHICTCSLLGFRGVGGSPCLPMASTWWAHVKMLFVQKPVGQAVHETEPVKLTLEIRPLQMVMHI